MTNKMTRKAEQWLARLLRGGIRFRLFLLVTLIILPFAALLGSIYHQRYETRRNNALQLELEVARGLSVTITAYVDGIRMQSLSLGHAISILSPAGAETIKELLMTASGHSSSVRNISWVSVAGKVLASSAAGFSGTDLSGREYFKKVVAGSELAVGDLTETGAITNRPTIVIATAIRDYAGRLEGVVVVAVEPTRLGEVALAQKRTKGGALALFDSSGIMVYHSEIKDPSWEQRVSWHQSDVVLGNVLRGGLEESGLQKLPQRGGSQWVSARVPVAGLGWVAGAGRDAKVAFAEIQRGMIQDALLGAAVLALAFLLAYLLGRNITAPLLRLKQDAQLMGEGKVVIRDDLFAPAEVRSLRDTLLAMTTQLLERAVELRESEASLRTIFDNVYDGIVIHDVNGRVMEVNQRWLEMVRLTRDQIAGLTIIDLSAAPPPLETLTPMWQEVLAGQTRFFEWVSRRPADDSIFDVEVFLCPIRFKGRDMVMGNVRDITERKRIARELQNSRDELEIRVRERTEDLERAFGELRSETEQRLAAVESLRRQEQLLIQQSRLAAMGEMMVNISHQWRQPLNVIGLIVQELAFSYEMGSLSLQEMEARTAKVMEVVSHLSQTIDDFRNLFSPDKTKARFSVREVVERVLALMEGEMQGLHVKVEVSGESDDSVVEGLRNEYLQVILNIMANARDVLRERGIARPHIRIRVFRESGRSVVTIADNGGGIAVDVLERIFDPYFTTKGPDKGTGVGLFMSKTIIEKNMGGSLTVSNTAEGAEFRIEV